MRGCRVAVREEHAGEVSDGGYDYGEVVAPFPEAVVGGLITEDLEGRGSQLGVLMKRREQNRENRV